MSKRAFVNYSSIELHNISIYLPIFTKHTLLACSLRHPSTLVRTLIVGIEIGEQFRNSAWFHRSSCKIDISSRVNTCAFFSTSYGT